MDRRTFLAGVAGASVAGASVPARAQDKITPFLVAPPPDGYRAEAARLTVLIQRTFWDTNAKMYRAPVRSAESVDSKGERDNGYVLWPALMAFLALVEGEKTARGQYAATLREVFDGLEVYYDPTRSAYNAWVNFPGNNDKYYDDNAWLAAGLVEAYEVTRSRIYLDRAAEMTRRFLRSGWDSDGKPGGMRWGTDPTKQGTSDHNACTTASTALAALHLARVGVDRQANTKWAREALTWIVARLRDRDGLIQDGLRADGSLIRTKWTYNTGTPLLCFVEHYRLTADKSSLQEAKRLASAAKDRSGRLYDGLVRDPEQRFWNDAGFFIHHLAEGLLALYRVTGDAALLAEVQRNTNYAYTCLRDPDDGLYWRNWRLWRIGAEQLETWRRLTGQEHRLEPDDSERSKERRFDGKPLLERPLVKTLLANAGTARLFWLAGQA